jgi:hypothetical protein
MKNSNDIIGNRTRNLPVCNEVPQPRSPSIQHNIGKIYQPSADQLWNFEHAEDRDETLYRS